ncbi:ABC transporter, permease protein [Selenomonas sp. oral taxon 892 str. F0426]|uniref:ABC transporter permease n=1 Tax=Selenomonas sp. oral taxon 892 TaxID=1321785 RepID=UPI0003AD40B8|nr:ABC transporter permease [Selenomonas sp. oral taxon 892]ERJ95733.1 ABC transporter, permease protein [Selenomonas sp. oral taxon 892 str. F0426]
MERYTGAAALIVLACIVLSGIFAPQLAPMNPFEPNMAIRLQGPTAAHLLGTDALGRDLLSRMLYGGRSALLLSLVSTVLALGIGTVVGVLAGYFGGRVDDVLTTVSNVFQGIPGISFMVAVAGFVGPGVTGLLLALVVGSWAGFSRIVRAEVMQRAAEPYVEHLRVLGCDNGRVILRHILPALGGTLLVLGTLRLGRGVLAIAGLSFLGLGVQPPTPDWSTMISDAMLYYRQAPHLIIVPGAAIVLLVSSLNMVGQLLRHRFDVRQEVRG